MWQRLHVEITQGLNPNYTRRDLDSVIFACLFRIYFWLQNPRLVFVLKLRSSTLAGKNLFINKQECIPVGCLPSATVAVSGGCLLRRGCLPRGVHTRRTRGRHPLPKNQKQAPPPQNPEADTPPVHRSRHPSPHEQNS